MKLAGFLVSLVAIAMAGCAVDGGSGSAADDSFTLPSNGKSDGGSPSPGDARTIRGVLSFDDIEGGCPFLEAADGTRYEVVYPDGWAVDRTSGRLRGPDGQDVAPGTTIEIAGSIARDRSSICQVGPIVVATQVTAPAP